MYRRKENIEVENLDWESHPSPSPAPKNTLIEETKIPFKDEADKTFGYTGGKEKDFLNEHLKLVLSFTLLIFPYILGFILTYFLYYVYGGMNIIDFIIMQQGSLYFQLWVIGMYLVIVFGIIWTLVTSWSGFLKN